jgi:bacterioferritin
MQGHPQVVDSLNMLLAGELTAIDQYFAHAHMYRNWGLNKLADHIEHETLEERDHADRLAKRILFLEGQPDLSKRDPLNVGQSVPEMLRNDLAVELRVITNLRMVMALCESLQDYETRNVLQKLLEDTEEDHTWWLEKQLRLIDSVGLQNYLQSQMESGSAE